MTILKKTHVLILVSSLFHSPSTSSFVRHEGTLHYRAKAFIESPTVSAGRNALWLAKKSELSSRKKRDSSNTDGLAGPVNPGRQRSVAASEIRRDQSGIVGLLRKYNLDSNIEVVHTKLDLPVIGEVFVNGEWNLCLVKGFKPPSSLATESKASEIKPPRVEVLLIRENYNNEPIDYKKEEVLQGHLHVVDMGQIISIWTQFHLNSFKGFKECANYLSSQLTIASDKIRFGLPVNRAEISMKGLYESRVKVRQGGKNSLTKKKISQICSALPSPEYGNHVGQIIHSVRKAGRLVNYSDAGFSVLGSKKSETDITQSLVGAMILAQDASLGGRFIFLSSSVGSSSRRKEETNTAPTVATPIKTVDSESVANWLLLTVFSRSCFLFVPF